MLGRSERRAGLLEAGASTAAAAAAPPSSGQPSAATVLLFEDNADAAESLRFVLAGAGYRVWVERTGRRAIEIVRRIRPDIVLCDLGLPDRDGYTIASDLRSDQSSAGLPLIAMTGYGAVEDQVRSKRAGFDLHLTKPVPPALLLAELSRRLTKFKALNGRSADAPSPSE